MRQKQQVMITRKTSLMRRMARSFRRKGSSSGNDIKYAFDTLGGVYTTDEASCGCGEDGGSPIANMKSLSDNSMNTFDTEPSQTESSSSHGSSSFYASNSWNSSGSEAHHEGAPLISRKAASLEQTNVLPGLELGEEEILGRIMLKSRKLPQNDGYYASNHVMINNERVKRQAPPLKRMRDLDAIAREQAKMMAAEQALFHAEPIAIQEQLGRECGRRIGENVSRGTDLHTIHAAMMDTLADKNNIMDRRFTSMGVGTAKASDGTLYLCQIFRD